MSFITTLIGSKLAIAAIAVGTLAVGGTAAAAYTGSHPAGLQDDAHSLVGAPTAGPTDPATATATPEPTGDPTETATPEPAETSHPDGTPSPEASEPPGPDATGPAAFGLCTAFEHGGLDDASVSHAALVAAAGSADDIAGYCAAVGAPGHDRADHSADDSATSTPEPSSDPSEPSSGQNGPEEHSGHEAPEAPEGSGRSGGEHGRP